MSRLTTFLLSACILMSIMLPSSAAPVKPDDTLPESDVLTTFNNSRISAGVLQDTGVLDDVERLLDIIANRVERLRNAATNDTTSAAVDKSYSDRGSNKVNTADGGRTPPLSQADRAQLVKSILGSNRTTDGNTTLDCIGISVCNPVTVIKGKKDKGRKQNTKD